MNERGELYVAAGLLATIALELRRTATLTGAPERHVRSLDSALRDLRDLRRRLRDPEATPTAAEMATRATLPASPARVPTLPFMPPQPPMRKP